MAAKIALKIDQHIARSDKGFGLYVGLGSVKPHPLYTERKNKTYRRTLIKLIDNHK